MQIITTAEKIKSVIPGSSDYSPGNILDADIYASQGNWIRPILTDNLYYEVIDTPTSYTNILDGLSYTNSEGKKRRHEGVRVALAYYVIHDIIHQDIVKRRDLGAVVTSPTDNNTRILNDVELARIQRKYLTSAKTIMQEVVDYMNDQYIDNFDPWECIMNNFENFGGMYMSKDVSYNDKYYLRYGR